MIHSICSLLFNSWKCRLFRSLTDICEIQVLNLFYQKTSYGLVVVSRKQHTSHWNTMYWTMTHGDEYGAWCVWHCQYPNNLYSIDYYPLQCIDFSVIFKLEMREHTSGLICDISLCSTLGPSCCALRVTTSFNLCKFNIQPRIWLLCDICVSMLHSHTWFPALYMFYKERIKHFFCRIVSVVAFFNIGMVNVYNWQSC